MRMRKKKNLDERLAAVHDLLFEINMEDRNFKTADASPEYINFEDWFGRVAPLYVEIGCGKGKFVCEAAKQNPEINFIAVEKSANVIVAACEAAKEAGLKNVKFIKGGAEYLGHFLPSDSVDRIFLNFSCPFPKKSYASHRLTHRNFLSIYRKFMKSDCEIHQKTDNMHFFEFSLHEFSVSGFCLKNISLDLHKSDFEGNIETEYEHRFASLGFPIYRLEAYLSEDKND